MELRVNFKEMPAPEALEWVLTDAERAILRGNQEFIRSDCARLPSLYGHPDQGLLLSAIWQLTAKAGGRVIFRERVPVDRGFRGGFLPIIGDIPGTMTWGHHGGKPEVVVYWESHVGIMGYAPPDFDFKSLSFLAREEAILVAKALSQALLQELGKPAAPAPASACPRPAPHPRKKPLSDRGLFYKRSA